MNSPIHSIKLGSGPKSPTKLSGQHLSERFNRLIGRMIEREGLEDIDEINDFIQKKVAGRNIDELLAEEDLYDPAEEAQELAYLAMESNDPREIVESIQRALELDPDCIDAECMRLQFICDSGEELIRSLRTLIAKAEKKMGRDYIEENRGHFWGMTETRPYMRTLNCLLNELILAGRDREAVKCCEKMLELNPNDNQGIRDTLLGLYLKGSDLESARRLMEKYPEEIFAVWLWGKTLERFLSGDLKGAHKLRKKAVSKNRHVLPYLTGQKRPPQTPLTGYTLGGEEEARHCLEELGPAWKAHPEAMQWLNEN